MDRADMVKIPAGSFRMGSADLYPEECNHPVTHVAYEDAEAYAAWGRAPDPAHARRGLVLARRRTIDQDPAFVLRMLVDIAIRALSPAVNDPTTAVQALDRIEGLLVELYRRAPGPALVFGGDDAGRPRPSADVDGVPGARADRDPPLRHSQVSHPVGRSCPR